MRDLAQNKQIGERLEITRLALGYEHQTDFADALSTIMPVSVQRWNNYECGRERITVKVALILYAKFDVSLDWVYAGKRGALTRELSDKIDAIEASRR